MRASFGDITVYLLHTHNSQNVGWIRLKSELPESQNTRLCASCVRYIRTQEVLKCLLTLGAKGMFVSVCELKMATRINVSLRERGQIGVVSIDDSWAKVHAWMLMLPEITCVLGCEAAIHILFFHLYTQSTELINTAQVISL